MRIQWHHLEVVFKEVPRIRARLNEIAVRNAADPCPTPVSLDDITAAIHDIYGYSIEVRLVDFDTATIEGMIEIYEDKTAIITIDANLNLHDTRVVFVKEACHIVFLTKENETKDPSDILERYVHNRPETDDGSHPNDIVCEEITKHAACELLFPPELRQKYKDAIASGDTTSFKVSEELIIPENIVEYVLEESYMDNSARMRGEAAEPERFMPPKKENKGAKD